MLSEAHALQASPTSLSFQAVQGGPNPSSKTVKVYKSSSRKVSWSGKDNAGWLSLSPTSGTLGSSTQVTVSVNISGLAAGTYSGTVTITTSRGKHRGDSRDTEALSCDFFKHHRHDGCSGVECQCRKRLSRIQSLFRNLFRPVWGIG
jgi:hypothetical protein